MNEAPQNSPYELMGGEDALKSLVDRFYFYMDILPEAAEIRAMHQKNLTDARQKLFKFLSGWLGGPDLYIREYGHPRLKMRHFPFSIGNVEKDQWMLCMNKALSEMPLNDDFRKNLSQALRQLATHMMNQGE